MEIHKPIPSSTTEVIVVSVDLYGLVSNSCKCLVICNKDVSTSNSNPGLVMTLGVNFWNIVFPKSGPDSRVTGHINAPSQTNHLVRDATRHLKHEIMQRH